MKKINIILPDKTEKVYSQDITPADIAKEIGEGLFRHSLASKVNGKLFDLDYLIKEDSNLEIITSKSSEAHEILLHSTAHLMAHALKELYPDCKIAIGPALKETFYYDIDLDKSITPDILEKVENKMRELSKSRFAVKRHVLTKKKALSLFKKKKEDYKVEIIGQINDDDMISAYEQGNFIDLCRGPHIPDTSKIKYFKLLSTSGAYWRGDEKNKMLQRIYGTAWFSKVDLDTYLENLEESKKRDHRKLGKELELFAFNEDVGPGLPLWLPNGTVIIDELEKLAREVEFRLGYERVRTPHLTKGELYKQSGHLEHFKDSMYPPMVIDETEYYVKPMNCPHHHKIFSANPKSYRDLPIRYSEYGTCYRYEKSGQLFGLMRVRSMQMNDAHIYCSPLQFKKEFLNVCQMYLDYFKIFGIKKYEMRLSLHDPNELGGKYVDHPDLWIKTEQELREILSSSGINYVEVPGEAAFYGPKIDVQVWSAIGREFTLATNQVDFAVPSRFGLYYTDKDGKERVPLCIHRAPLGTHERFIGFLIEHFGADFPLWLSPQQVSILPISEKFVEYAEVIKKHLLNNGIRVKVDVRNEKIGAKIRAAELKKIPIMLIIGEKEQESEQISVRRRFIGDLGKISVKGFLSEIIDEIKSRRMTNR